MAVSYIEVIINPLNDENNYGPSIDVTDYLISGGIGKVAQTIDSGNYDIGLYTYADLTLTFINYDGKFNDNTNSSSIFYYTRDRAIVTINFFNEQGIVSTIFSGLINDEATRQDIKKDTVKIKVLSRDSILRKTKVAGGLLKDGDFFIDAIKILLNRKPITNVLIFDESLITVGYNNTIDKAEVFSDVDTRSVLESLMNASGSVFRVNNDGKMVVSPRNVSVKAPLELFGGGNQLQQDNIISIKDFNDGLQRTFNTFTVNEQTFSNENFVNRYGASIKSLNLPFITTEITATEIAEFLVNEFKQPKNELEVIVPVDVATNVEILDPVKVVLKRKAIGYKNFRVPIAGVAIAGSDYVPFSSGGLKIENNKTWKVTGITEDTKNFETKLRLREA